MELMNSKEKILLVAMEEFAEHGKSGARIDRIAKSAGVNKAMIYYYFSSKALLYKAVLQGVLEEIMARQVFFASSSLPPVERITTAVSALIDFIGHRKHIVRLLIMEILEGGETISAVAAELSPGEAIPFKTGLAGSIEAAMRQELIRGEDVVHVALNIFSLCVFHGFFMPLIRVMWGLSADDTSSFIEARKRSINDLLVHGMFLKPDGEK